MDGKVRDGEHAGDSACGVIKSSMSEGGRGCIILIFIAALYIAEIVFHALILLTASAPDCQALSVTCGVRSTCGAAVRDDPNSRLAIEVRHLEIRLPYIQLLFRVCNSTR